MLVWLSYQGLAHRDIARIMEYKLGRGRRSAEGLSNRMNYIHQKRREQHLSPLYRHHPVDLDKAAVHNFLIGLTDDTRTLGNLLWFDYEHMFLVQTVHWRLKPSLDQTPLY